VTALPAPLCAPAGGVTLRVRADAPRYRLDARTTDDLDELDTWMAAAPPARLTAEDDARWGDVVAALRRAAEHGRPPALD
jgi:hypothetical protein